MPEAPTISASRRAPQAVLLYDGDCGLCNRAVGFLMKIDRDARLHFTPLQSSLGQRYLRSKKLPSENFDSLVFVPDWSHPDAAPPCFRTDAALHALALCGEKWKVLATILRVVPRPLRDLVYRLIARVRYRLFGPYRPTDATAQRMKKHAGRILQE